MTVVDSVNVRRSLNHPMASIVHRVTSDHRYSTIAVDRDNILMSSYKAVSAIKTAWFSTTYYPLVKVSFNNEFGQDGPSLYTEWLILLIEAFFKDNPSGKAVNFTAPLFQIVSEESGLYAPNMEYSPDVFKFAGSVVALAFNREIGIKGKFIESIYRSIWGEATPFETSELMNQDPAIWNQFQSLLNASQKTLSAMNLDLKKGQKVEDYVKAQTADILYERYKPAIEAFVSGFNISRNLSIKSQLSLPDFKLALTKTRCSVADLRKAFVFHPHLDSLSTKFLQVFDGFTDEQVMKFIKFVTNLPTLTFDGVPKMNISFNILGEDHLPTASTCSRQLTLPRFGTVAELRKKIIFAIEETDSYTLH